MRNERQRRKTKAAQEVAEDGDETMALFFGDKLSRGRAKNKCDEATDYQPKHCFNRKYERSIRRRTHSDMKRVHFGV